MKRLVCLRVSVHKRRYVLTDKGDIKNALITSFMTFDEELKSQSSTQYNDSSGTTAVSVLMQGNKIYCVSII